MTKQGRRKARSLKRRVKMKALGEKRHSEEIRIQSPRDLKVLDWTSRFRATNMVMVYKATLALYP